MKYAPIAIFCYKKIDILKRTVEALLCNPESNESVCYFFSDGFKKLDEKKTIDEVREYIHSVKGFSEIHIIESDNNKGLANSLIDGVSYVVNKYGRVIVVEDDILTSRFFLKYMNSALDLYEKDDDVACISGYVYPVKTDEQSFFIRGSDCWGWATWKRAWKIFNPDGIELINQLIKHNLQDEFDFDNSYQYMQMLRDQIQKRIDSWAIRWYASCFISNKLCLYPGKTYVQNIGLGSVDATHCQQYTNDLDSELVKEDLELKKIELKEKKSSRLLFTNFFRNKYKSSNVVKYGFSGDYINWNDCKYYCKGYEDSEIFDKTLNSALKVKNGEAVFERDSYIFDTIQYSYPLLSALFKIAVENNNTLSIVDFGGALGSHYFQNKDFLSPIKINSWNVVEQERYVEVGNKLISDNILRFYSSIDLIENVDVLLLSSVIQYLPDPYKFIDYFLKKKYKYIIVDRTAFSLEKRNRLTLQKVPPIIYKASYPAWFLNEKEFLDKFSDYDKLLDFVNTIDVVKEVPSVYKGFLFKLKNHN